MIPQTPDIMKSPLCYEGDKRNIPADTPLGTNQLSYKQGFPPITSIDVDAGGIAPERQDMNAALNLLSTFIYYMQSGNQFVWNNQLDYNTGAFVIGSDNAVYFCIKANGATEPNTVQDPISSTGYWVQILTSDGKLNAEALNVTLGAFATLNSLNLSDNKLTGKTPVNKGGTNTDDGFNWKNTYGRDAFFKKIGYTAGGTLEDFISKAFIQDTNIMLDEYVGRSIFSNFPGTGSYLLSIRMRDQNFMVFTFDKVYGYEQYIAVSRNARLKSITKTRNDDGTIPSTSFADNSISGDAIISLAASKVSGLATVATSGSYNDLTNKPTIPANVAPLPVPAQGLDSTILGVWRNFGSYASPSTQLPSGGTWAYFAIGVTNGSVPALPTLNNPVAGVAEGGSTVSVDSSISYILGFCWRIQ